MSSHDSNYHKMSEYRAKTPLGKVSESRVTLVPSAQFQQPSQGDSRPSTGKRKYASVQPLSRVGQSSKGGVSSLYMSSRSPTESLSEVQLQQQQTLRDRNTKKINWYWSRLHFPIGECDKLRKTILADNSLNNLKAQNGYILVVQDYYNKKEKVLSAIAARNSSLRWLNNTLDRGDLTCAIFQKKIAKSLRLIRRENIEIHSLLDQLTALKTKSLVWLPPIDELKEFNIRGLSLAKNLEKNQYMKRLKLFVKDFIYFEPQSGESDYHQQTKSSLRQLEELISNFSRAKCSITTEQLMLIQVQTHQRKPCFSIVTIIPQETAKCLKRMSQLYQIK